MKLFTILLLLVIAVSSCNKETANCVNWIVSDGWYNESGTVLQDYNLKYGLHTGYDLPVCGAAKDTIFEGKKVVLRSMHDMAFYVREYIVKKTSN